MFKKLGLLAVIVFLAFPVYGVVAKNNPPAEVCLNPGSYIFALAGDNVFRIKMDAGRAESVTKLPITVPGTSFGRITANACHLVFSREKSSHLSDLFNMNPSTGWEQNNITRSPEMAEYDPVLDPDGYRVAFTRYEPAGTNVVSEKLDGTMPMIEAKEAVSPAWQARSPVSYSEAADMHIVPWGAYGYSHQYLPDRSGILVEDNFHKYFIWPAVGVPSDFGTFASIAIRPSGTLAAVITVDGTFELIKLDARYLPYGEATPGPAISGITSLVWIEVK